MEEKVWFAMSAPFCKELEAKKLLDKRGIENFIPMQYQVVVSKSGKKQRELRPAVHNLLFARATRPELQETKEGVKYLQYYTRPEGGKNVPVVIPDRQMQQFMAVSKTCHEKLFYLRSDELPLQKGRQVRIIGGGFDGGGGGLMKVRGGRNKKVVVEIPNTLGVVFEVENADMIEVINK